jgi:DNA-binding FadR family transcriptional regulator
VIWKRLRHQRLDRVQQDFFSRQHEAIVGAIAAHDAEQARQAMRAHLESFERLYLSVA